MQTDDHEQSDASRRAPALFRDAMLALECPAGDDASRCESLRTSARRVVDAFLAARGARAATDGERVAHIVARPVVDAGSDRPLHRILAPGPPSPAAPGQVAPLERAYRALLPALRSALAAELPQYQSMPRRLAGLARSRRARLVAALMGAACAAAAAGYHVTDPAYQLRLGGQIYWKPSPEVPFSEARSQRFDVRVDGAAHVYRVPLPAPTRIDVLRLDPVDRSDATEIDIQAVHLVSADGRVQAKLGVDPDAGWRCHNCRWVDAGAGVRLQPSNDDPFIVGPRIGPLETAGVQISMRASAEKTFWEWVTRLEKPHE